MWTWLIVLIFSDRKCWIGIEETGCSDVVGVVGRVDSYLFAILRLKNWTNEILIQYFKIVEFIVE